ncbi:MAG: squalene synthase HpnC [Acidobacteriaceae bacterium]|nr:squalene synthase HpnC [Acidobacteriaceae bacterium]
MVARSQPDHRSSQVAQAYAACAAFAREHYENFPVASLLLPAAMRPHIAAIYAFARIADDMADEGVEAAETRQRRLLAWRQQLHDAVSNREAAPARVLSRDECVLMAVADTIRVRELPLALFDDLISAFTQDTTTRRYDSWEDVMSYCRRSANPVGRLVLLVAGDRRADVAVSSDALCTALQLTNFWQDFGRDWTHGRLYVPQEVLRTSGAREADLAAGCWTPEWTRAIETCIETTRDLFGRGRRVADAMSGRLRVELRATWLGGRLVLDRIAAHPHLVMTERPTVRRKDAPRLVWQLLCWRTETR